ncbi:TetR/AcrR family transcriptional regulator [Patulibacter sp.]|uniref:TetR/AcrR family transcriptional regulator n=1 Tax=Patulibacter sp. TaxID=1912859 RepID=UPI0027282B4F|nr:TetR/AcrR family transcriptional regulator [Patulibacter sp.]MDO9410439.1 TetR/AcrR family transcriptional regulator [Patulibacter sp.]
MNTPGEPTDPSDPVVGDFPHGRVPRAVREQQVLRIAQSLFAERGYQGASMDELASRAGVSKPVVYDLVGSKESLYLRCVERAGRALAELVADAALTESDPERRMRAGAVAFLHFVAEEHGGWDLLLTAGPEPGSEPILAIRAQQSALLTELTRETVGGFGVELDEWRIEALAHALNGAFEGLAYWWQANRDVPPEELVDWITALFYPGIKALAGFSGGA